MAKKKLRKGSKAEAQELGRKILKRRSALKWCQKQLATESGISQGTISRLERGLVSNIRNAHRVRLAGAFGKSYSAFGGLKRDPKVKVKLKRSIPVRTAKKLPITFKANKKSMVIHLEIPLEVFRGVEGNV